VKLEENDLLDAGGWRRDAGFIWTVKKICYILKSLINRIKLPLYSKRSVPVFFFLVHKLCSMSKSCLELIHRCTLHDRTDHFHDFIPPSHRAHLHFPLFFFICGIIGLWLCFRFLYFLTVVYHCPSLATDSSFIGQEHLVYSLFQLVSLTCAGLPRFGTPLTRTTSFLGFVIGILVFPVLFNNWF
jgi:hypothetical protein